MVENHWNGNTKFIKTISPHILRISRRQSASKTSRANILRALSLIPPLSHPLVSCALRTPSRHRWSSSLRVQVPEDEGIRGERDMDWHSNSFGKGSTILEAPLIFLQHLGRILDLTNWIHQIRHRSSIHPLIFPLRILALKGRVYPDFEIANLSRDCFIDRPIYVQIFLPRWNPSSVWKKEKQKFWKNKSIRKKNGKKERREKESIDGISSSLSTCQLSRVFDTVTRETPR